MLSFEGRKEKAVGVINAFIKTREAKLWRELRDVTDTGRNGSGHSRRIEENRRYNAHLEEDCSYTTRQLYKLRTDIESCNDSARAWKIFHSKLNHFVLPSPHVYLDMGGVNWEVVWKDFETYNSNSSLVSEYNTLLRCLHDIYLAFWS
jgi:hypothetical protein